MDLQVRWVYAHEMSRAEPRNRFMKKVGAKYLVAAGAIFILGIILMTEPHASAQSHQLDPQRPWLDRTLPVEVRAALALEAMTLDEKIRLVHGRVGFPFGQKPKPDAAIGSAGYVEGVPRLGIPALQESDAGLGVANPHNVRPGDEATPFPSGLAIAATFDAELAELSGRRMGAEARAKGFNVLLAGGANIARDPRNGRNFEYAGEDPLLTGIIVGSTIRGIQGNRIISTIKHFALNAQETDRLVLSANIDPGAARESDLLAFQIGIEVGRPHAIMSAYNRVNGTYSSENDFLLNQVLKRDWAYSGFVMSDWGAVHTTEKAALSGLDQESGEEMDEHVYFGPALKEAVEKGNVPLERLNDMVRRILRSMFASGIVDDPPEPGGFIDYTLHAETAQTVAERGLVLLRNRNGTLPLAKGLKRIAVIGSHADKGVLSGGGSSQVIPVGGIAVPNLGPRDFPGPLVYDPSSPVKAIEAKAGGAQVEYVEGDDISRAAEVAKAADAVIIFAHQWMAESYDAPDLTLPDNQDHLIAAIAAINQNTVVVLETGGPVSMPWLSSTAAVIEAWYPGARGGEAIARALFGEVNPSGRLPITFPLDESQFPRGKTSTSTASANAGEATGNQTVEVNYFEGADVGYKWFDKNGIKPLFPFGFGLSYTAFAYRELTVTSLGSSVTVSLEVKNVGAHPGAAIPQFYVRRPDDPAFPIRLAGWNRVMLDPGETRRVTATIDPRLLARFDTVAGDWEIAPGRYRVEAGADAGDLVLTAEFTMPAFRL
jgi:beta-glucosidase